MKLSFLGAAREVTGSCFLVETERCRFLVDCGMVQGGPEAAEKNRRLWPFDPRTLDFVLLTHAHIDHSGLLPRLTALGFRGTIHTTRATADLLEPLLLDSAHIQEAEWIRSERGFGRPRERFELLYTVEQARACLRQLRGRDYGTEFQPHPSVRVRFQDAGHILGSASIEVWVSEGEATKKLVFSGDIGPKGRPIVRDPTPIEQADYVLIESTYGNREHRPYAATLEELTEVLTAALARGRGNVYVPAFALGRTQELLHVLIGLTRAGRLPPLSVYVDSPLADKITGITWKHFDYLDEEARALLSCRACGEERLRLRFTQTPEESMALNRIRSGALIIASSGMAEAGRIRHHLRHGLPHAGNAVVFVGYQAQGTLGRQLVDGASEVRLFGERIPVRASIHTINGLSAHADRAGLLEWLGHFKRPPKRVFITHGEGDIATGFAQTIRERLGFDAYAPAVGESFTL
ncbi:MAG: MBL fold metallo-hydrolase [Casimicrobiaceae bacterium]|nr:MBL fold metallo-hydrolase [Casimicrobiaceae bacterium]